MIEGSCQEGPNPVWNQNREFKIVMNQKKKINFDEIYNDGNKIVATLFD